MTFYSSVILVLVVSCSLFGHVWAACSLLLLVQLAYFCAGVRAALDATHCHSAVALGRAARRVLRRGDAELVLVAHWHRASHRRFPQRFVRAVAALVPRALHHLALVLHLLLVGHRLESLVRVRLLGHAARLLVVLLNLRAQGGARAHAFVLLSTRGFLRLRALRATCKQVLLLVPASALAARVARDRLRVRRRGPLRVRRARPVEHGLLEGRLGRGHRTLPLGLQLLTLLLACLRVNRRLLLLVAHHVHLVLCFPVLIARVAKRADRPRPLHQVLLPLIVHVRVNDYLLDGVGAPRENLLLVGEAWADAELVLWFVRFVLGVAILTAHLVALSFRAVTARLVLTGLHNLRLVIPH